MTRNVAALSLSTLLVACVQAQPPAPSAPAAPPPAASQAAQAPSGDRIVVIRKATCDTLLGLSPDDRAVATMFYIGYQASQSRARTINVGAIPAMETQAIKYCEAHPASTVSQAFNNAYVRNR
jgi:HdeA/HdeB family